MLLPRGVVLRHRRVRWMLGQALIVATGLFCYFQVRGLTAADPETAVDHARDLIRFEQAIGIDHEEAVQAAVTPSDALSTFANWIYIWGHWPVIIATMLWLGWRHREVFVRLRDAMLISGGLGLIVFVTYPVAPPRLVDPALIDTVTERSSAYRYLQPPNFVNQYAAMPSLHAGWDLLVGISIATAGSVLAVRLIGWLLPLLMAFAVVATANHYLIDVIAGVSLALLGLALALVLERRRSHRRPAVRHARREAAAAP
jgi:membrane-associated phospholipid phosphatase